MFKTVKYKRYKDGKIGYNFCRSCHKNKTAKNFGYCFCSGPCLERWIENNKLILMALSDYKDIIFNKNFDVKKILSLEEAKKKLGYRMLNDVDKEIEKKIRQTVKKHLEIDDIEYFILNSEKNVDKNSNDK